MREHLYTGLDGDFHDREMAFILDSAHTAAFLALAATGEPAGLLELSLRNVVDGCIGGPVGYIEGLWLAPGHRGRGDGRRLVDFAAAWFREQGCRDMATDALLDETGAQAFWRRAGFEETWRVVQFKRPLGDR